MRQHSTNSKTVDEKKRTPESLFYDGLKGHVVEIIDDAKEKITAKLLWVDRYSLILWLDGQEQLFQKKWIRIVRKSAGGCGQNDISGNSTR